MKNYSLKYLDFLTYYSSKGDIQVPIKKTVCFSNIFHARLEQQNRRKKRIKNTYEIIIYHDTSILQKHLNNQCWLTEQEIKKYISQAKKYVAFTYKLIKNESHYVLYITLNARLIAHKFLLSYIRYLYESPFSLYLYETVKLKQQCEAFADLDYLSLFNIVSATVPCFEHGTNIHGIGASYNFKNLLSCTDVKTFFKTSNTGTPINDIFPYVKAKQLKTIETEFNDTAFWISDEERLQRSDIYLENYNFLKTLKK